jgi:hypothetical protein
MREFRFRKLTRCAMMPPAYAGEAIFEFSRLARRCRGSLLGNSGCPLGGLERRSRESAATFAPLTTSHRFFQLLSRITNLCAATHRTGARKACAAARLAPRASMNAASALRCFTSAEESAHPLRMHSDSVRTIRERSDSSSLD